MKQRIVKPVNTTGLWDEFGRSQFEVHRQKHESNKQSKLIIEAKLQENTNKRKTKQNSRLFKLKAKTNVVIYSFEDKQNKAESCFLNKTLV